jgi:hypothetical protein
LKPVDWWGITTIINFPLAELVAFLILVLPGAILVQTPWKQWTSKKAFVKKFTTSAR